MLANYKEPDLNELFDDCAKDVLKGLQEEMSNLDEESAEVEDKDRSKSPCVLIIQLIIDLSNYRSVLSFACFIFCVSARTFTPATQVMQATQAKTVRIRVYFCLFDLRLVSASAFASSPFTLGNL